MIDVVRFKGQENGDRDRPVPGRRSRILPAERQDARRSERRISVTNIVINEIMYNPISGTSDDEYVELYNRGASSVNLGGWRLTDAISFTFPPNTVIPAGGYLVVANKLSQTLTNYPALNTNNTFGNYGGTLGNSGERLALTMPDDVVSTNGVSWSPTSSTSWSTKSPTAAADAGANGPTAAAAAWNRSIAHSDHRLASNWADSDESDKSAWTTIEYTGVLDNGNGSRRFVSTLPARSGRMSGGQRRSVRVRAAESGCQFRFRSGPQRIVVPAGHPRLFVPGELPAASAATEVPARRASGPRRHRRES